MIEKNRRNFFFFKIIRVWTESYFLCFAVILRLFSLHAKVQNPRKFSEQNSFGILTRTTKVEHKAPAISGEQYARLRI